MSRRRMLLSAVAPEAPLTYGVYIQDTTGKLWKAGAWDGSATPNGVAVYDESCSFIIALGGDTQLKINSSNTNPSMTSYNTEETAKADFNGAGNTEMLLSKYGSVTTESAGYCASYTFPNGQKGYLGSAGEWNTAFKYKDEIDAILAFLGGDALKESYWTSTYYGKNSIYYLFWYFNWINIISELAEGLGGSAKITATTYYTRPFGVLDIEGAGGGSGPVKTLNKITMEIDTFESPTQGSVVYSYAKSVYPVASDITVTLGVTSNSHTVTISEGETQSNISTMVYGSILSVTPTEDDTYIYTF